MFLVLFISRASPAWLLTLTALPALPVSELYHPTSLHLSLITDNFVDRYKDSTNWAKYLTICGLGGLGLP